MKIILLSMVLYVIGISLGNAYHDVSLFHPWILQSCISRNCLWTTWFNVGKPYNSTSGDSEDTADIIAQNPETMCKTPIGVEAQSINYQTGIWIYEWRLTQTADNVSLVSFYSTEPAGVDFRVRYCCPNDPLINTRAMALSISANNSTCGIQEIAPQTSSISRIFGEVDASANSWPWMVYLHKQTICPNETCSNGCSAILIDRDHLITAAHCIEMIDPIDIILIAGAHNLSSTTETAMRQLRTIKQIFFHPQYNSLTIENNIAVLRVNTSFIFTKYVQPTCLSDDEIQSNKEVIVISWGGEQLRGTSNKILKQIYTTVVNNCNFYWPLYDTNRQLCVSDVISSNSACHNNEIGAILTLRRGQYVVDGIASYVKECNTTGKGHKPVVYTRISTFKTWINQIVELKDIK